MTRRKAQLHQDGRGALPFLEDITPFLYGKPITFVDIGAHQGNVLKALRSGPLYVRQAHLIEPNALVFQELQKGLDPETRGRYVYCHNIGIGSENGTLSMRREGGMSHVLKSVDPAQPHSSANMFTVPSITLDTFVKDNDVKHIHLLKIDVEGFEKEVLIGAAHTLNNGLVDVIYVEAGISDENPQQTYYRVIEDQLARHGYKLFRIYEQTNEWPTDSAVLRRVNMAFMSPTFLAENPYKVTRELFAVKKELREIKRSMSWKVGYPFRSVWKVARKLCRVMKSIAK
jgi:FkbM family methyltransferase